MYNFIGGEIVVQDDACGSVFEVERVLKDAKKYDSGAGDVVNVNHHIIMICVMMHSSNSDYDTSDDTNGADSDVFDAICAERT
jgi:hypothetical protein